MQKTWKPTVAGILNIITAASSLFRLIVVIIALIAFGSGQIVGNYLPNFGLLEAGLALTILLLAAVFLAVTGILPLMGGIFSLQRRRWGWALAGSIAAIFSSAILGILATIFTVMARDEFE
jgi:hypothetical protein